MKTILITGGSKGIGKSVVNYALSKNYRVIFTYNKNKKFSNQICKKYPERCMAFKVDLSKEKDRDKLFKFLNQKKINIDCLINNAAFGVKKKNS